MVSVRRKGVTKLLERWKELMVNHISADIFLLPFESILA
jgi:hypothetical protein